MYANVVPPNIEHMPVVIHTQILGYKSSIQTEQFASKAVLSQNPRLTCLDQDL